MSIIQNLNWRYATKAFDANYKLSSAQLQTIKEAFNLTALSYGLQTLKLVIVEDKAVRETLVAHAFGQRQVADSSHLLVLCIQNEINDTDVERHFKRIIEVRNTPEAILASFKQQLTTTINGMSKSEKDAWATKQAYIALGNLMTVCAVEEIDSCPMEGFNPKMFDELLNLNDKGLKSVLLLPIGKRSDTDFFAELEKVRQPITSTVIEL